MNKRGISAVVATVLIILITVSAVTIVWTAIIPMIRDNLDFSALEGRVSVVTSKGYTVYDASSNLASVQVKRDVDDGVMDRIVIAFSFGGSSVSSTVIAPASGQSKVYTFDLGERGEPDSVSVAPIFSIGEKEREGDVTSEGKLDVGDVGGVDTSGNLVYEIEKEYFGDSSCLEIHNVDSSVGDGVYTIDPDGEEGGDPFEVYCDMTTEGGGWILLDNFVSSNSGDMDVYGVAIGGSNIKLMNDLESAGYDVYLDRIEQENYEHVNGYLQMYFSGSSGRGYIEKVLPDYTDEVYVKWGNWYSGRPTLEVGGEIVDTADSFEGSLVYQRDYSSGDSIRFEEGGIFWVGEIWVR